MSWFLACPICDQPITKLNDCDGFRPACGHRGEVACPTCRYVYQVVVGPLQNWSSRVQPPEPGKKRQQTRRHYELRLSQPQGPAIATRISVAGEVDSLPLCQGDLIAVISVQGRQQRQDVVSLINRTAGETISISKPGHQSQGFALRVGAIAAVLSGTLLTVVAPQILPLAWLASLPLGVSAGVATRRRFSKQTPLSRSQVEQLQHQRELLQQQIGLEERLQTLTTEQTAHAAVAQKCQVLKARLMDLPETLGPDRLALIDRVLPILEQQLEYDQQLVTGYRQLIDALDIEYEATRLTAELPEELVFNFNRRLAELEAVELHRQQLTAELAMRKVAF